MEKPKPRPFWSLFVVGLLLILLFAVATKLLRAWASPGTDEDAARAAERMAVHAELVASNATRLGTYAWVDKSKGTVQIPISQAIELTIQQINTRPPAPAGPITPAAAPAAAPAN